MYFSKGIVTSDIWLLDWKSNSFFIEIILSFFMPKIPDKQSAGKKYQSYKVLTPLSDSFRNSLSASTSDNLLIGPSSIS